MSSTLFSPPSARQRSRSRPKLVAKGSTPDARESVWARLGNVPSWLVSFAVHLAILLGLATITRITLIENPTLITSELKEDYQVEDYKFEATVVDAVGNDSAVNTLSPSQAAATQVTADPTEKMEKQLESELLTVETPVTDRIEMPEQAELIEHFDATGTTEHTGGVDGAIDRLTFEIAASLRERKTLAIWMFDASQSLNARRDAIADRFENVYEQLGQLNVGSDKALKTAVVSFGQKTDLITPDPIDDVEEIVEAVRNIQPDESGDENVFTAVELVVGKWKSYRTKMRRNVMIIIVTDERGDDYAKLEPVLRDAKRLGIKVYCVGNAAVFGRDKGYVSFTDSTGYQWSDLEVDAGPETVRAERLQLAFWGVNSRDLEFISAGYGPYALTRLCTETGGLYLVADETRVKFDPAVMRNYSPDYRPIRDYQRDLETNLAKGSLVRAAASSRVDNIPRPQLMFRAENDNILRQQITEAQKPLTVLDYRLNEMYQLLTVGERDRDTLDTPRWRASFDLAMGRVLAMRVRAYGYNSVLAEMKRAPKPFEKERSNHWRLVASDNLETAPVGVRKIAKQAEEYLKRVIDEHPGTPWALLAERELSQPMGWDWQERFVPLPSNNGNGNNPDRPRLLLADEDDPNRPQQRAMQRPPVKPKL